MRSEIDKIIQVPGIIAVCKIENGNEDIKVSRGDAAHWRPLMKGASDVLHASGSDEIKIVMAEKTAVIMSSGSVTLGVVVVKSHPVVKSLKRMMRRAFKNFGSPVSEPSAKAPAASGLRLLVPDPEENSAPEPGVPLTSPHADTTKLDG